MQDADADKDRGLIAAFRPLAWDRKGTRFMQKRRVDNFWKGKNVLCGSVAGLLYFLWIWCLFHALQNGREGQTIINYNNLYIYIYIHTHGLFILCTLPNACWLGLSTILKKSLCSQCSRYEARIILLRWSQMLTKQVKARVLASEGVLLVSIFHSVTHVSWNLNVDGKLAISTAVAAGRQEWPQGQSQFQDGQGHHLFREQDHVTRPKSWVTSELCKRGNA